MSEIKDKFGVEALPDSLWSMLTEDGVALVEGLTPNIKYIAAALNSRAALAAELEAVKANVTALIKEYSHIAEGAMADGDHADYLRWNYHAEQLEAALRTQQGGGG